MTDLAIIAKQMMQTSSSTKSTPALNYVNTTQSNAIFHRQSLPPDVLHRYSTRDKPLTKSKIQPFSSGDYFHHDPQRGTGNNLTIVTTGHILYHDYVSKEFRRSLPSCVDTHPEYLRSYYAELYEVCLNKGIYIPHYFLLRHPPMTRQSSTGIEFGTGKDLPQQLEIRVPSWSGDILYALRKAFNDKSRFHRLAHMERDGYSALNMIFAENHPNLDPIPLSLTDTPPLQTDRQNIHQFWTKYQDYLHLKSWVENIEKDLSTREQVDLFITKCRHSAYLRREIVADQRNDPRAFLTRYTGTRLPTTVQQLLDTAKFRDGSLQQIRFQDTTSDTLDPQDRNRDYPPISHHADVGKQRSGPTYRIRQIGQDDTAHAPSDSESDDDVETIFIKAVQKQARTVQPRTSYCLLCNKKDHFFNACPTMDLRDMKLHLKLQLQINEHLAKIKKKGLDNIIPVKEMQLLDSDTAEAHHPPPQDFRTGSS
jgi:hypothetical protein